MHIAQCACILYIACRTILTNGTVNMYYYASKQKGMALVINTLFTLFAAHVNITFSMIFFCATLVAAQLIPVYCITLSNKNYIVSHRSEKICNINHYKSAIYCHRSARSAANCNRSAIDHSAV